MTLKNVPISLSISIAKDDEAPYISLRREIQNKEIIIAIIEAALHEKPVLFLPMFRDKTRALSQLLKNGVIYEENGKYKYF